MSIVLSIILSLTQPNEKPPEVFLPPKPLIICEMQDVPYELQCHYRGGPKIVAA